MLQGTTDTNTIVNGKTLTWNVNRGLGAKLL